MEKNNCYSCKFKGSVPGSAHSSCTFFNALESDKKDLLIFGLSSHQFMMMINDKPAVSLNEHGIKNGWANWPLDFDPVWLSECQLFLEKNDL